MAETKRKLQNCCWDCEFQKHYGYGLHKCVSRNKKALYYHAECWNLWDSRDCLDWKPFEKDKEGC